MNKESGIYKIINTKNGKIYIGSSKDLYHRWDVHKHYLRNGNHCNNHLQSSWNLYGECAFVFFIIEKCDNSILVDREQFYINTINPEYNMCKIAGSPKGRITSLETRKKLSLAGKGNKNGLGKKMTEEAKRKLSLLFTGKKLSEEHKKKLSDAKIGRRVIFSEEHKRNLSIAGMGRKLSVAHIENLKKAWKKRRIANLSEPRHE